MVAALKRRRYTKSRRVDQEHAGVQSFAPLLASPVEQLSGRKQLTLVPLCWV